MENVIPVKYGFDNLADASGIMQNRLDALKALANLLAREVESLKPVNQNNKIPDKINLSDEVRRFEESLIREALIKSKGQQRKAARLLGTKISTLHAKIKRYGIESYSVMGRL